MKKTSTLFWAMVLCLAVFVTVAVGADESLSAKCSAQFQKVTQCLPFVTAKAAAPSKDCCASATALMKESDPACLCFIIQQIHNGSNPAVKSMGVQEALLLQLPSACKLANASISDCPRLLHLPPNSPDAIIFTNASTTPVAATPGMLTPTTTSASDGFWHKPRLAGYCSLTLALAIFFFHAFGNGERSV
ncbi:hypothetical protein OROHE_026129 [Orobanche hederae]